MKPKKLTKVLTETLTMGFKLELNDTLRKSLSESLAIDPGEMMDYLQPKDADYVRIPVRALSATAVQGDTINFGHNNGQPLKDAVAMFDGLTILKDHMFSVDNWVGHTEKPVWDDSTPDIPAGVNLMLVVDTKADPKTARGLISGDLNSVSVTVSFEWEKSHPKMSDMDFYFHMGEVVDGKRVQALVTKITRLYEISVVWQGADKYAKKVNDDGTIDVPGTSNSESGIQGGVVDPKKLAELLGLKLENPTEQTITEALQAQGQTLATAQAELTAAKTKATEAETKVTQLTTDLTAKTTEVETLTNKVKELEPKATLGDTFVSEQRAEALKLYNLVEGDKATDAMRQLIKDASLDVAKSFINSYKERAEQVAPLKCTKCGGEVSRKSSQSQNVNDPETPGLDKAQAERLKQSVASIHG